MLYVVPWRYKEVEWNTEKQQQQQLEEAVVERNRHVQRNGEYN